MQILELCWTWIGGCRRRRSTGS